MGANSSQQETIISWKELSKHNKETDIWIVIASNVYNVTKYLQEHPGGKDILLKYAGSDASEAFAAVESHKNVSTSVFKQFYIGNIEKKAQPKKYEIQSKSINYQKWKYTKEDIQKHNQQGDLWVIVDNQIIDLTEFQKQHPGGQSILQKHAGEDIKYQYNQVQSHSPIDKAIQKYRIGILQQ